jgi:cytosine/adenosine deaminase-related metal-dependent hydrolase
MTAEETAGVAASGAVAGLCPITEASLGDGIFNGAEYAAAAGRWGVGSDSNIEISAAGELKLLEYSQRYRLRARNVLGLTLGRSTGRALYDNALAGGAQATGRRVGAIAPGHRADLVVLAAEHPDLVRVEGDRWLDAYIFVAGRAAIDKVFVGGRCLVENGRHVGREAITARYKSRLGRLPL